MQGRAQEGLKARGSDDGVNERGREDLDKARTKRGMQGRIQRMQMKADSQETKIHTDPGVYEDRFSESLRSGHVPIVGDNKQVARIQVLFIHYRLK